MQERHDGMIKNAGASCLKRQKNKKKKIEKEALSGQNDLQAEQHVPNSPL